MPDALLVLAIIGLLAVVTLAVILVRGAVAGAGGAVAGGADPAVQAALLDEVRALMRAGKKINAVKLMRDRTGLSLGAAKAAVEEVDRSGRMPGQAGPRPVLDLVAGTDPDLLDELRHLKQRGRLIEAITLLRSRTGVGLREAKDAFDQL